MSMGIYKRVVDDVGVGAGFVVMTMVMALTICVAVLIVMHTFMKVRVCVNVDECVVRHVVLRGAHARRYVERRAVQGFRGMKQTKGRMEDECKKWWM